MSLAGGALQRFRQVCSTCRQRSTAPIAQPHAGISVDDSISFASVQATVRAALKVLPHAPGVYLFRDQSGRVIYVGRSRDLARRVRSYWVDLGDRPHLARMVARVQWIEPVVCASEHEAAFLESDLLDRHRTRFNRTLGMESQVWLRLETRAENPSLEVRHQVDADGASWFGPYLGWEPARHAAGGLHRLFAIRFAGSRLTRSDRELARSLGVAEQDLATLAISIRRVLDREPRAVHSALHRLKLLRDDAARRLAFEHAALLQTELRSLQWICAPQKLSGLEPVEADVYGAAGSTSVVLALRGGRLSQRHVLVRDGHRRQPDANPEWVELACANASLMNALAHAQALGPLGWRPPRENQT